MKYQLKPEMTFEKMIEVLKEQFAQYEVKLLKNPLLRFEYIEVKKNAVTGIWIRRYEKKENIVLMSCIPSAFARAMLGLIFYLIFLPGQNKVKNEVAAVLEEKFQTSRV